MTGETLTVAARRTAGTFTLDAALEAPPGVTAVLGASGAGKSTLVAIVAGLVRPDRGRVVLGADVLFDSAAAIDVAVHRRGVRVVFQDSRLFPHLTVRSNLLYGTARGGRGLDAVVDLLDIGGLLARRPRSLSGGERQRVAIGRALLSSPRALMFDEPLASLDAARRAEILPYVERLVRDTPLPVLYVTHALEEARRLASRLVVMEAGRVVASGPLEETAAAAGLVSVAERLAPGVDLPGRVAAVDADYGLAGVAVGGVVIWTTAASVAVGDDVILTVPARDLAIATVRPEGISIRNILPAAVREVSAGDGPAATVALDVAGARLLAEVPRRAVDELGLAPGREVFALPAGVRMRPAGR